MSAKKKNASIANVQRAIASLMGVPDRELAEVNVLRRNGSMERLELLPEEEPRPLLGVGAVAHRLGLCRRTAWSRISSGKIKAAFHHGRYVVAEADLLAYVRENPILDGRRRRAPTASGSPSAD